MNVGKFPHRFALAVILILFIAAAAPITAEPMHQEQPCVSAQGCREPVNPEGDEYYSIECDATVIYVWRDVPNRELVTLIGIAQVATMSDGGSFVATGEVTVTRSSGTITLSGTNGNLAPQSGTKSFNVAQCSPLAAALPDELIFPVATLSDEQVACMNLPTEQEKVDCLNTQTCEDPNYRNTHWEECGPINCRTMVNALVNRRECFGGASDFEIGVFWREYCFGPVEASALVGAVVAFKRRRKRK
jgi:hypothetical protein